MNTTPMLAHLLLGVSLVAVSCSTSGSPPFAQNTEPASVMEVPVIPDEAAAGQEQPPPSETAGEIQERGVTRVLPGGKSLGVFTAQPLTVVLGEFAIRTTKGYYLTAVNGGGRLVDPTLITATKSPGPWERFRIAIPNPGQVYDKTIQTATGNFVTAVGGGGRVSDVLHSDATQVQDWERFHLTELTSNHPSFYGFQTIKGNFLTAVGAGGKYDDAIHTDATAINAWERFRIVKCGDPGTGQEYGIMGANGQFLFAQNAGGRSSGTVILSGPTALETKFKLFKQSDGTYAFQTSTGRNFITALQGGGLVQSYRNPDCGMFSACIGGFTDIFHTDAVQVQGWEKFRVIDQGNCTYAIQTTSGFFMGIYRDSTGHMSLTTRRDGAPTANEKFQLVVYGLGSPLLIQ